MKNGQFKRFKANEFTSKKIHKGSFVWGVRLNALKQTAPSRNRRFLSPRRQGKKL